MRTLRAQEADPTVSTVPLSISALSIDLLVALTQRPDGMGAGELGRLVDGAPTSVQSSLRTLATHHLIRRDGAKYLLAADHPGVEELVAAGLRLSSPEEALRLVLRASDSVEFASQDAGGFVVGLREKPNPASMAALERSLATISRGRPITVPTVLRFEIDELARIVHSAMGLRSRLRSATILKGAVRTPGPLVPMRYPNRPGRTARIP